MTDIPVVEIVKGFEFTMSKDGPTGRRCFVDASVLPNKTVVSLPNIGDKWSDEYPECRLRDIRITYIDDNDLCGKQYECNYSARPDDQLKTNDDGMFSRRDERELATQIDTGAETLIIEPYELPKDAADLSKYASYLYKWQSDDADCAQPIYILIPKHTIVIERIISDSKLDEFFAVSAECSGKVNKDKFFELEPETVLYLGASMVSQWSPFGLTYKKQWKAKLTFIYRPLGWQYIWRNDKATFDKPLRKSEGEPSLYQTISFEELLTAGGVDVSFPDIVVEK